MDDVKKFSTILILDWKKGKFRAVHRKPKSFKPSEIPISFSLNVSLPKQIEVKAHGDITLSELKVAEIVAEEI